MVDFIRPASMLSEMSDDAMLEKMLRMEQERAGRVVVSDKKATLHCVWAWSCLNGNHVGTPPAQAMDVLKDIIQSTSKHYGICLDVDGMRKSTSIRLIMINILRRNSLRTHRQ